MTTARLSNDRSMVGRADLLIFPAFATKDGAAPVAASFPFADDRLQRLLRRDKLFTGAVGQVSALLVPPDDETPPLLAVGMGASESLSAHILRLGAMAAARASIGRASCAFVIEGLGDDAVRSVTEGFLLGRYDYAKPETESEPTLLSGSKPDERAFAVGLVAGRRANWARRLVERPSNELTPEAFAGLLVAEAERLGITAEIWDAPALAAKGFGAVRAVGGGSRHPPLVVALTAGSGKARLGLAGKGITFDSGGLNLKRKPEELAWMKSDMAAAAAVAGALFAARELDADPDVLALLPIAENMPGGDAQRPGDVITHPDGRRTEVTDTDSEGRLILADAIAFLAKSDVAAIIDIGTLTDGGGVGPLLWGAWGNDDKLARALIDAGERAGDPGWRLPLRSEYERFLASKVADITNAPLSSPDSGQIAATYLRSFAGNKPWLHVDNGSSAYLEQDMPPWPEGATGSPLRALLQLLIDRGQS